jgi:hypothetical protein
MRPNNNLQITVLLALVSCCLSSCHAFTAVQPALSRKNASPLFSSAETEQAQSILSVSWEKPLGMILEEVEEGAAKGVYVLELAEEGAAAEAPEKDQIVGSKLMTIMGEDVASITFDEVMNQLVNAPSPVDLEFIVKDAGSDEDEKPDFEVGTNVKIIVHVEGEPDKEIEAKVGDNLRTTLQENGVEVYRGFKAKIGNCGGGGQCGKAGRGGAREILDTCALTLSLHFDALSFSRFLCC